MPPESKRKTPPPAAKPAAKAPRRIEPIAERYPALEEQEVEVSLCAPEANVVQVAGTFNDWRPAANPLAQDKNGEWVATLRLKAGIYEYRFVVDGVWTDDPEADRTVANPHGGTNAVLKVGLDDRADSL